MTQQTYSENQIDQFVRNQHNLREEQPTSGERLFFFTDSDQAQPAIAFTPTPDSMSYTLLSLDPSLKALWQQAQTEA